MLKLFKYEGYKLSVEPEILLITPFKKLWDRDKSKNKERVMMEFGYIYFFCDPRSDYQYLTNPVDRMIAIKEGEGFSKKWEPDEDVKTAMSMYESFKPSSALLLEDTRVAIDKLRTMLREIDLNEKDDKGRPVYTLNTITSTIKQIPALVRDLNEAEKSVRDEMKGQGKMRGSGEKTVFEDGFNF